MGAEARDDLVEHERRAAGFGDPPQLLQEGDRLQARTTALDRLDHYRGNILAVSLDPVEAPRIAVRQHGHVGNRLGWDAWCRRQGAWRGAASGSDQYLVELAVIVIAEDDDAVTAGHRACHAHCRHHRLGAGVAEGHALVAGHFRYQRGDSGECPNIVWP